MRKVRVILAAVLLLAGFCAAGPLGGGGGPMSSGGGKSDLSTLTWYDYSAVAAQAKSPWCVFRGQLVCGQEDEVGNTSGGVDNGIILNDGAYARLGGKINADDNLRFAWGIDDVGLFVYSASVNGATLTLQKSPDGVTDFTDIADVTPLGALGRSLVDCGRHTLDDGDGNGNVERRVLLYFTYPTGAANNTGRVYYSAQPTNAAAGDNGTWNDLFGAVCPTVDHFHGGVYIKGKGLYVMTGDDGAECSILFCAEADIASLIESPATWAAADHWGLTTGARSGWGVNYKSAYVLGANGQSWRTVDFVSADGRTAYYIPDSTAVANGQIIYKVDLYDTTDSAAGTRTVLKNGGLSNVGWYGGATKSGLVLLSTASWCNVGGTGWATGSDGRPQIWAIDPDNDTVKLAKTFAAEVVGNYYIPNGFAGLKVPLFEYGGAMMGSLNDYMHQVDLNGETWTQTDYLCGIILKQKKAAENLITNGDFSDGFTGWINSYGNIIVFDAGAETIANTNVITGKTSGATATVNSAITITAGGWATDDAAGWFTVSGVSGVFQENEIIKVGETECATVNGIATYEVLASSPVAGHSGPVLRVVSLANSLPYAAAYIKVPTAAQQEQLEGGLANWSCKIYIDEASDTQGTYGIGGGVQMNLSFLPRPVDSYSNRRWRAAITKGQWITLSESGLVDKTATLHYYSFRPNTYSTNGAYLLCYVTDFQLVRGSIPNDYIKRLK